MKTLQLNRNSTVDCMKGILIALVVLGHTYNPFCSDFIYLFHVGMFFVLSGYCFNQKYTNDAGGLKDLLVKRIKSLWVPYVAYNFVFLLLQNVFLRIGFLTTDESYFTYSPILPDGFCQPLTFRTGLIAFIKSLFFMHSRPFAGGLWFLGGLFYVTFLYAAVQYILRKLKIEKLHIVFSVMFLCAGWLIVRFRLMERVSILRQGAIILISEVLFCAGTYIREYVRVPEIKRFFYGVGFLASFVLLCVLSHFDSISIASVHIVNPLFYISSVLIGGGYILCFIKLLSVWKKNAVLSFFSFAGRHTIPVLALHPICYKIVTYIQWKIYGGDSIILALFPVWKNTMFWSMAYLLVGFCVPLVLVFLTATMKQLIFRCWLPKRPNKEE